jgi:ABC-type multidrug transport system ATPase subunit
MSKIKIKNFGPIKEGFLKNKGFLEIKKVTVFVGNQGSGKSTVAKLISTFSWIEKVLVRGDYDNKWFSKENILINEYFSYHRIENYFHEDTEIAYIGDAYSIKYKNKEVTIAKTKKNDYNLPQIMYVPAERNFIAYAEDPRKYKDISASLIEFLSEYTKACRSLKKPTLLPINDVYVEYDKSKETVFVKGGDYRIKISEASSGFQSLVPLYLASQYLCNTIKDLKNSESMSSDEERRFGEMTAKILSDNNLTDKQKRITISEIGKRFNKTVFVNIIEEPEQNLYPISQWQILQSLLEFNNEEKGNKLIMTTHSPYLINNLTLAVKADELRKIIKKPELENRLKSIISLKSTIHSNDLSIYELDEKNGTIEMLETYNGLPSDENKLNEKLEESNELFAQLLEIQQLCQ